MRTGAPRHHKTSSLERLPVVDDPISRRVVGIVSRSDLVRPFRVLHDEDVHRERVFGLEE